MMLSQLIRTSQYLKRLSVSIRHSRFLGCFLKRICSSLELKWSWPEEGELKSFSDFLEVVFQSIRDNSKSVCGGSG